MISDQQPFFPIRQQKKEHIMQGIINIKKFFIFSLIFVLVRVLLEISIALAADVSAKPAATATIDIAKLMRPGYLKDMVDGNDDAPVTIIEYASITCSHCADFYQHVLSEIREKYIRSGKVRFIFREFAYDPRATAGFMLSRCAPENRYFPLIQVLFEKQAEWAFVPDARLPLSRLARLAGFTDQAFDACLKDQTLLDNLNSVVQRGRDEFGITSTPTFFINGKKYEGMLSIEQMSSIIEHLL